MMCVELDASIAGQARLYTLYVSPPSSPSHDDRRGLLHIHPMCRPTHRRFVLCGGTPEDITRSSCEDMRVSTTWQLYS